MNKPDMGNRFRLPMDFVRRLGNSIKQLCGGREGNADIGRGGKAKAKVTQTKTPKEQREGRQKKKKEQPRI